MDKLKIELVKSNISIIAIEGFEELGDVSFQMEKLKVKSSSTIIHFSYFLHFLALPCHCLSLSFFSNLVSFSVLIRNWMLE